MQNRHSVGSKVLLKKTLKALNTIKALIVLYNQANSPNLVTEIEIKTKWRTAYQNLFFSISKGEYYLFNCNRLLSAVNRILEDIDNLNYNLDQDERYNFDHAYNQYLYLNQHITNRCNEKYGDIILNIEMNRNIYPRKHDEYNFFWIFSVGVKLAVFDEGYIADNETLGQLSRIHHDLSFAINKKLLMDYDEILKMLKFKCSLLLYKLYRRKQKDNNNPESFQIFNDSSFEDIKQELLQDDSGKAILKTIENHYFSEDIVNYKDINDIFKTNNSFDKKNVNVNNIHFLVLLN